MVRPQILAIGGAHIDRRGQMTSPFVAGASIPGTMREYVGGGAFNALRSAVQTGPTGAMISVRGGDAAGDAVAAALQQAGIEDLGAVFLDRSTPSYTALLDRNGDVMAALADMQLYELAFPRQLRRAKVRQAVQGANAILADANIPATGLAQLPAIADGKPIFAIAISPAKAVRLQGILPALAFLYMNRREATALTGSDREDTPEALVAKLKSLGLRGGVITHGGATAIAFDHTATILLSPPEPRGISDVTGAGDALAGVMTAALLDGMPLAQALRHGMAASLLAIETQASIPDLSGTAFTQALALVQAPSEIG